MNYIFVEFSTKSFQEVGEVFRGGDDIHVALFVCRSEGFRCPGQKPNARCIKFSLSKLELLLRM